MPQRRSVAVIGSGVAGLTAAYLARRVHDVTLFEKDDRLGGHADTHMVTTGDGRQLGIDTGFIVHNTRTYPTLLRLFAELGVATQNSSMSFGISCRGCGLEYSGGNSVKAFLPRVHASALAQYGHMLLDITRFHRHARALLRRPADDTVTLGDFISAGRYSRYFSDHFLLPLSGAVWSSSPSQIRSFPARYLLSFFANHGLLGIRGAPQWKTVVGGSHSYVRRIREALGERALTGSGVTALLRDQRGVTVVTATGEERRFDQVIVATHPNQALSMLEDPSADEERVLGAFRYSTNTAVLHTDRTLLPRAPRARSAWNYLLDTCATRDERVRVTYGLNILQDLSEPLDYCVTLNDDARIDPATVLDRMTYDHPVYTVDALAAQRQLPRLNGVKRTYFCGAYQGWGFHEDGCLSGARVATQLGGGFR